MKRNKTKPNYTSIGGSALLEGVMMRSESRTAIACRRGDGSIILKVEKNKELPKWVGKIPVVRGVVNFIFSMMLSYGSLSYSADIAMAEITEEEPQSKFDAWLMKVLGDKGMAVFTALSGVLGILLAVLLFFALPSLVADGLIRLWSGFGGARALLEGICKILIFICYLLLVSQMKDIQRVFEYHGAEHKSIFCFENKWGLCPENAKKCKRLHPRCGTSFLFLTLIVSILVSLFLPDHNLWLRIGLRILFIPLMLGLAYEAIKLAGKYDNLFTRILSAPGLWFQRITTKEPDEEQLEVAIAALEGVLCDYPLNVTLRLVPEGGCEEVKEK